MPTEKDQGYIKGEEEVETVSFPSCLKMKMFLLVSFLFILSVKKLPILLFV